MSRWQPIEINRKLCSLMMTTFDKDVIEFSLDNLWY